DQNGNVYVVGGFQGMVDFDPGAGVASRTSSGGMDGFVVKLTTTGSFVYPSTFAGADWTASRDLAVGASGAVYVVGDMQGFVDFDPGPGVAQRSTLWNRDLFITKLDAGGQFQWASALGGDTTGHEPRVAVDGIGNVYFAGYNNGGMDFDP